MSVMWFLGFCPWSVTLTGVYLSSHCVHHRWQGDWVGDTFFPGGARLWGSPFPQTTGLCSGEWVFTTASSPIPVRADSKPEPNEANRQVPSMKYNGKQTISSMPYACQKCLLWSRAQGSQQKHWNSKQLAWIPEKMSMLCFSFFKAKTKIQPSEDYYKFKHSRL